MDGLCFGRLGVIYRLVQNEQFEVFSFKVKNLKSRLQTHICFWFSTAFERENATSHYSHCFNTIWVEIQYGPMLLFHQTTCYKCLKTLHIFYTRKIPNVEPKCMRRLNHTVLNHSWCVFPYAG